MSVKHLIALSVALASAPIAGSAFEAVNKMQVKETDADGFEVSSGDKNTNATAFWCAAGDFVLTEQLEPDDTLIYVLTAIGDATSQSGDTNVIFTIQPTDDLTAKGVTTGDTRVDTVGYNMTAFAAKDICPVSD